MRGPTALPAFLAVAALAAGGAAGAGARARPVLPPRSTARSFFLTELHEKLHGDWAGAWASLYPLHQSIAPEATYVRCERMTRFPAPLKSLAIESVVPSRVHVLDVVAPVQGVAVTVRVTLLWYGPRDPVVFWHRFHLVPVDGHWTWLLSAAEYDAYRAGRCPAGSTAQERGSRPGPAPDGTSLTA